MGVVYLVRAFFAAYGKGKTAVLIPASADPTFDTVAADQCLPISNCAS